MSDRISFDAKGVIARVILDAIGDDVPRDCTVVATPDAPPWITTKSDASEHFRGCGLSRVAKDIARTPIPRGTVLMVMAEDSVRLRVIDLMGDDTADIVEPESTTPSSAIALGALGAAYGGGR